MKITTWKELKRRFAAAAKTKDADELAKLAQEMPDEPPPVGTDDDAPTGTGGESHTHVHIHQGGGGVSSGGIVPPTDDDKEGVAAAGAAPAAAAGGDVGARLTACEAGIVEIKAMLQKMSGGGGSGAGEGEAEPVADAAMKKIEGDLKEEAPEGTQDSELVKVKDSAFMEDSFAEAVALAEILSPGIQIPTFDSTAGKFDTYKSICALRRKALLAGNQDTVTSMLIEEARGRRTTDEHLSKLTCDSIRPLFRSAAIAKKRANNLSSTNDHRSLEVVSAGPRTNADINKRNADYWAKH